LSHVDLTETQQAAVRFLLAAEPLVGRLLPSLLILERLAALVRCDAITAAVRDSDGYVLDGAALPPGRTSLVAEAVGARPLRIGVVHWRHPHHRQRMRADGLSDSLAVGFRNGKDRVVQVWWDRRSGTFSDRDLAVLTMIAPALQRLVQDTATAALPASLTVQERRTLMLVAAGFSNDDVAATMGVATCTVRKHLEHAYRKLGVTNRLAAVIALRGELIPPSELPDRLAAGG
jgi:DNA-binding CsgD family transcriptional regulator